MLYSFFGYAMWCRYFTSKSEGQTLAKESTIYLAHLSVGEKLNPEGKLPLRGGEVQLRGETLLLGRGDMPSV